MRKTNDITAKRVALTGGENQKSIAVNGQKNNGVPAADPIGQMESDRDQAAEDYNNGLHSPAFRTALDTTAHVTQGLNATATEMPAMTKAISGVAAFDAGAAKVASIVGKPV